jgi:hypothetical protein
MTLVIKNNTLARVLAEIRALAKAADGIEGKYAPDDAVSGSYIEDLRVKAEGIVAALAEPLETTEPSDRDIITPKEEEAFDVDANNLADAEDTDADNLWVSQNGPDEPHPTVYEALYEALYEELGAHMTPDSEV